MLLYKLNIYHRYKEAYLSQGIIRESTAGAPEEEGVVIGITEKMVRVRITKGSACSTCASAENCPFTSEMQLEKDWQVWAKNDIDAKIGDRVKVMIAPSSYLIYAALLFIVPVSVLFIVYFVARLLGIEDRLAVSLSIIGAILVYVILRYADKSLIEKGCYRVVEIISAVQKEVENQ